MLFILRQFPLPCINIHFFLLLFVFITLLFLMLVFFAILLFLILVLSALIWIVFGSIIMCLLSIMLFMWVWGSLTVMLFVLVVFFMLVLVELILLLIMMDYFAIVLVLVIIALVVDFPVFIEAGRLSDERLDTLVGRGWVLVQEKKCVVSRFLMSHNLDFLTQIVLALSDSEDLVDDGRQVVQGQVLYAIVPVLLPAVVLVIVLRSEMVVTSGVLCATWIGNPDIVAFVVKGLRQVKRRFLFIIMLIWSIIFIMTFSICFLQSSEVLVRLLVFRQIVVLPPFHGVVAMPAKEQNWAFLARVLELLSLSVFNAHESQVVAALCGDLLSLEDGLIFRERIYVLWHAAIAIRVLLRLKEEEVLAGLILVLVIIVVAGVCVTRDGRECHHLRERLHL